MNSDVYKGYKKRSKANKVSLQQPVDVTINYYKF
jgi:hypothetical protein